MKQMSKKKRIVLAILCGALLLIAAACFAGAAGLGRVLRSQQAAERWQGDGETPFGQVSCFLPQNAEIGLNQIYEFRYAVLDKLKEAGYEADTDTRLFRDAWSTEGKATISSALGRGEASFIAVGGHYFDFHPIRLISGSYLSEEDLMKDQVLLDEELAWLLFGGTELRGLEVRINGLPFVVAGVIEREQDFASREAYTAGMGFYLSYDAYAAMTEEPSVTCYELVMAEPVEDFTLSFVREKFPIGSGEIVKNSQRYSFGRLFKLIGKFGTRSMQKLGVVYPYWENAARAVEDWSALLVLIGLVCAALPVITALVLIFRTLKRGKEKLEDDLLPSWKDKAGEALRKRQRKHWEKKHGAD